MMAKLAEAAPAGQPSAAAFHESPT